MGCGVHNVGRFTAAVMLLVWASALEAQVYPKRGRPIEFSEPRSGVTATNISELNADKTSLRKLEDEFKKPFEILGSGSAPAPGLRMPPPPARVFPAPPSRSMRELLQKRDQWVEMELEAGEGLGLTPEEMLRVPKYGPDGQPIKRRGEIERYYEELDRARAAAQAAVTNRAAKDALNAQFFGEEEEFKPLNLKLFEEPVSPFARPNGEPGAPTRQKGELPGFADLTAPRNQPRDFAEIFGFNSTFLASGNRQDAGSFEARKRNIEDLLTLRFVKTPAGGANNGLTPVGPPAPWMQNPLAGGANPSAGAPGWSSPGVAGVPAAAGGAGNPGTSLASGVPSLAGPPTLLSAPPPAWGTPAPPSETGRQKLAPAPFQIPQRKF